MKSDNNTLTVKNKNMPLLYIYIGLFIILSVLVFTKITNPFDEMVSSFVIGIQNKSLTNVMKNLTNIGGAYSLIAVSLILLAILKNKKKGLLIIINLVTVFLTSQILKFIFRRPRPSYVFLISARGFSYPSGHTMVSMAYIGFIIYLIHKSFKNKLLRIILTTTLLVLAIGIGFSRIYLGVHYATDVIAGYLLAIVYLILFINFISSKKKVKE